MPDLEQQAYGMLQPPSVFMGIGQVHTYYGHDRAYAADRTAFAATSPGGWTSASVVHDLRNPLATISAGLEIFMGLDSAPPGVKRLVANMSHAARRMRQLLKDLEDAARGNASRTESCEIGEIVAAAWETTSMAFGSAVQFELDSPRAIHLPLVPSRIERVFFNLMANACEAMPHGGKIFSSVRRTGGCVLVSVEDTGPGIPEAVRHRLFEPYATAGKEGGMGLGLVLARCAVRDHGGDLWIDRGMDPSAGARFLMRLPLAANA